MNYNKTLWEEFINDSRNFHLDSFSMKDHLQPDFWENDTIKSFISNRLIEIVNDFMEFCGLDEGYYEDITLTGSLANYNWSEFSDVDLHIIVDFKTIDENTELVREFFNSKRSLWNRTHDIRVFGFEVELYVQDAHESHVSTGVFSILNDEWLTKPEISSPEIDLQGVKEKASMLMDEIDRVFDLFEDKHYEEALDYIDKLKEKIKNMRKSGLEREGQYSNENLAFKILRRNGSMGELLDLKTKIYDKMMSISKNFVRKLKIFVGKSMISEDDGFNHLNEMEKYQKRVHAKHGRLKNRLIAVGGQENTPPYNKKADLKRSKSAPPGAGGV
jgi:hypothetical protein